MNAKPVTLHNARENYLIVSAVKFRAILNNTKKAQRIKAEMGRCTDKDSSQEKWEKPSHTVASESL